MRSRKWRRCRPRSRRRRPSSPPAASCQMRAQTPHPAAMEQVNQLNLTLSASRQYVSNGTAASANLQLEQSALTSATNTLQSARDLAVEANNSSLSPADRQDIATQLQQLQNALLGAANSTDPAGNYLFAG